MALGNLTAEQTRQWAEMVAARREVVQAQMESDIASMLSEDPGAFGLSKAGAKRLDAEGRFGIVKSFAKALRGMTRLVVAPRFDNQRLDPLRFYRLVHNAARAAGDVPAMEYALALYCAMTMHGQPTTMDVGLVEFPPDEPEPFQGLRVVK